MRTRNLVGATAGLTVVVIAALVIGISLNARYFLDAKRWTTLAVALVMAALIALGFKLMQVGFETNGTQSVMRWVGAILIWVTVLTPVVVGIVWWAFFSGGDF